jgi:hypothetical protein
MAVDNIGNGVSSEQKGALSEMPKMPKVPKMPKILEFYLFINKWNEPMSSACLAEVASKVG